MSDAPANTMCTDAPANNTTAAAAAASDGAATGDEVVVIAIDPSKNAEYAFNWYAQHMWKPNHRVIVTHCIEPPAVPSRDSWAELSQKERKRTKEVEDKYVEKMKEAGLNGKVLSEFGRPGEFIVELASKEGASFIVIGTRGMGTLRRTIMGSVSDYVVHHAHCPVVVCRMK